MELPLSSLGYEALCVHPWWTFFVQSSLSNSGVSFSLYRAVVLATQTHASTWTTCP